jgi:predicted RNA-binding Zn-ribbon protein involved in translation (DUF1610 family)
MTDQKPKTIDEILRDAATFICPSCHEQIIGEQKMINHIRKGCSR